jgi:hypothetical protein
MLCRQIFESLSGRQPQLSGVRQPFLAPLLGQKLIFLKKNTSSTSKKEKFNKHTENN